MEWSWRRHLLVSDTDCDLDEPVEFDRVGKCCWNWRTRSLAGIAVAGAFVAGVAAAVGVDTGCSLDGGWTRGFVCVAADFGQTLACRRGRCCDALCRTLALGTSANRRRRKRTLTTFPLLGTLFSKSQKLVQNSTGWKARTNQDKRCDLKKASIGEWEGRAQAVIS